LYAKDLILEFNCKFNEKQIKWRYL
jgi:hypothetical protein